LGLGYGAGILALQAESGTAARPSGEPAIGRATMNRRNPIRLSLRALPLLGALLAACSSPSPVDEVVDSNLVARGGKARIQALRSIRETGTAPRAAGGSLG
jgi:hypothetical protein